jgi:hypothetical protein
MKTVSALFALFTAIALSIILSIVMMPFVPDDAYVSFRYAEQFAETKTLTFNPNGDPVEGYSSFLWVLLCAAIHGFGLELPRTMPFVSLFFGVLNVVVLWAIYRRRSTAAYGLLLPLLLFAASGPFLTYAVSGMETALFSLLLLLAVFLLDRALLAHGPTAYLMIAVVCVFLSLCRPEGILAYPVIAIYLARHLRSAPGVSSRAQHRRRLRVASVAFVAGVIVYQVWRLAYFGSWLPPTFYAAGGSSPLASWTENVLGYFVVQANDYPPMGYYYLTVAALAVLGASYGNRARAPVDRLCVMLGLLYAVLYTNFVDPLPALRYHAALLGLLFVPLVYLPEAATRAVRTGADTVGRARYAAVVACLLVASGFWFADIKISVERIERANQTVRIRLGEWLAGAVPESTLLAIAEAGVVPYYSRLPVLDVAPSPIVGEHSSARGLSHADFFEKKPGVVVLLSNGVFTRKMEPSQERLVNSTRFKDTYEFFVAVRVDWYKDLYYLVYVPKDLPEFSAEVAREFPRGLGGIRVYATLP